MPINMTSAWLCRLSAIILSKFCLIVVMGKPRRPSFAPSSINTKLGFSWSNNLGRARKPPSVVSPLILALVTLMFDPFSSSESKATQPSCLGIP